MILSLRQIKRRIKSVESTKKITRAMQMVSTAKFKRSEDVLYTGRPYYLKLDSILQKLIISLKPEELGVHPLLEEAAVDPAGPGGPAGPVSPFGPAGPVAPVAPTILAGPVVV